MGGFVKAAGVAKENERRESQPHQVHGHRIHGPGKSERVQTQRSERQQCIQRQGHFLIEIIELLLGERLGDDDVVISGLRLHDNTYGDVEIDLIVLMPNTGVGIVEVKGGTITYADGTEIMNKTVQSRDPFRLPAKVGRDWEIQIEGDSEVFSVAVANSMSEIASG